MGSGLLGSVGSELLGPVRVSRVSWWGQGYWGQKGSLESVSGVRVTGVIQG